MDRDHLTLKTFMAIMAERDAAIQERNMALEERKRAFAERDMAMLQRDAAVAERNAATKERDETISSLQFRGSSVNGRSIIPVLLGEELATEAKPKHVQFQKQIDMPESIYIRRECLAGGEIAEAPNTAKAKRGRLQRDGKATKFCKSPKILIKMAEELSQQLISTSPEWWNNEHYSAASDDEHLDQQLSWKDDLGLNQITFDESTMPVPVCSCTGSTQPCYRWGSGGWQSACCTTKISMYPLPQIANKRYSRVGGRKMSGSAFIKLLNRVAAQGYDFSEPLDLKHHWAKHGTNRYTTLK